MSDFVGDLRCLVEALQGVDEVGERIGAESALRGGDPPQDRFAGFLVDLARLVGVVAVDRPEPGNVAVVAAAELGTKMADFLGVV